MQERRNNMKAPDKIYVASYNGEAFSHSWTTEPLGDTTATEYIRKDALIEWVEEQLAILDKQTLLHPDDDVFLGQRNAYKQMKDKLFRKSGLNE